MEWTGGRWRERGIEGIGVADGDASMEGGGIYGMEGWAE